jgi:type IV pilus assembly protein PilC
MRENTTVRNNSVKLLSSSDVSLFCSQVALLLNAGIPLQEGIGTIGENVYTQNGRSLISDIQNSLEESGSLYIALNSTGAFPKYMVDMVNIGEKAGKLDNVMESLALYYDRDEKLRSRIRNALLYPFILILMMAAVISILMIKVMPVFDSVFEQMGTDITATSSGIMRIGSTTGKVALVLVLIVSVILFAALLVYRTENGYRFLSRLMSNFPLTRRLSSKISSARFAFIISMLLSSGYDISEALALIPNLLPNKEIADKVQKCNEAVDSGVPFPTALSDAKLFPGIYAGMISIGAKTGNLDAVMSHLADIYDEDVQESVNKAIAFIEPALVAVLSVIIGAILLSVMLPLMGIMSSIG